MVGGFDQIAETEADFLQKQKERRLAAWWKGAPVDLRRFMIKAAGLVNDIDDKDERNATLSELARRDFYGISAKMQDRIEDQCWCVYLSMRSALRV